MKKQDRLKQIDQAIRIAENAKKETESDIQSGDTSKEKAEWLEIHTETEKRLKERRSISGWTYFANAARQYVFALASQVAGAF